MPRLVQKCKKNLSLIAKRLIAEFGTEEQTAKEFGVSQAAVHGWSVRGVPINRVLQIEQKTGLKFTRYELRPDIFPND